MPIETEVLPFSEWIGGALATLLIVAGGVALFSLIVSYLIAAVRHGPIKAGDMTYRVLATGLVDLLRISPRRVFALSRLAVQEAIRRRVWTVLVVFAVILIFAAWFLDPQAVDPARLYLSFVLTATTYLVCLLALFLSAFSLPNDIKNRTIYTVVTKPVRAGEIVLGRVVGFTAIGTLLLAIMGLASYVFVQRALRHTHELAHEDLTASSDGGELTGRTGPALNHRHPVLLDADGNGATEIDSGHWHPVTRTTNSDGKVAYEVGPHQDMLVARVPVRGEIRFLERSGQPGKGVNVGHEWNYRQFIEGGTLAAAIWTFDGVTPEKFPDGLPIEMMVRVFRTYKGEIDEGIRGSFRLVNPSEPSKMSEEFFFVAKDFEVDKHNIPRDLKDSKGNDIDLFDLVDEQGRLEVKLQCLERAQYFGLAQADMWLRAGDRPFWINFLKGHIGIWLQMLLIVSLGVMFSTFLSGAVAMIGTVGAMIMGFFTAFVVTLAAGVVNPDSKVMYGGGPFESFYRIVTQRNVMTDLDDTLAVNVMKMVDKVLAYMLDTVAHVLPDFSTFSNADYVAYGFDIPGLDIIARNVLIALAYVVGLFIAGYFFLKTREVAR